MKSDRIKNWPKVVRIGSTGSVEFRIDLTLHDAVAGTCLAVMDTKYKITDTPTSNDVAQIVAHAVARGARAGVLIYPRRLSRPFRAEVGGISVHAMSFPIDGDVEAGGRGFVKEIAAVLARAHVTAKLRAPTIQGAVGAGIDPEGLDPPAYAGAGPHGA